MNWHERKSTGTSQAPHSDGTGGCGRPAGRWRAGGRDRLRDLPDVRQQKIRCPHHGAPGSGRELDVGCVCAEKMSGDYEGRGGARPSCANRAARRTDGCSAVAGCPLRGTASERRWAQPWWSHERRSSGGAIGSRFRSKTYATKDEAKLALFDDFWAATQDDDRLWA